MLLGSRVLSDGRCNTCKKLQRGSFRPTEPRWGAVLLLPIDLDVFFRAAVGDRDPYAESQKDRESDQGPRRANASQNSQFPQRSQNATHEDGEAHKVHAHPFHISPDILVSEKPRRTG